MSANGFRLSLAGLVAAAVLGATAIVWDSSGEAGRSGARARAAAASERPAAGAGGPAPLRVQRSRPPVVMLILDEFPVDSLLGPDGQIDRARYPNFAALAEHSTWFRNAHTIYDSTERAVPAILDGDFPRRGTRPLYTDHERSVYDLFGRKGYRIVASEEASSVCPPRYCRGAEARTPDVLGLLKAGRKARLTAFIRSVRPRAPTLYLKHVLLPHAPHVYLPSGRQSRADGLAEPVPGIQTLPGFADRGLTHFNRQRLLLQIGFLDRQLGRLFARMRRLRMFNRSLIVVTADHGLSSEVGVPSRRQVTASNIDEVAPVPLFVKRPGQRRGRTPSTYARTIDVVPTMADVLGLRMPYRADGRSAFSASARRRRSVRMVRRDFSRTVSLGARAMERRRRANVGRRLRLFGSGPWRSLYTGVGPHRELLGRPVAQLSVSRRSRENVRAGIVGAAELRAVRATSEVRPTQIVGRLDGGRTGVRRDLAVAVNGRVEAVVRSFYLTGSSIETFAANVPEASIRPGRNRVQVLEVGAGGALALLGGA